MNRDIDPKQMEAFHKAIDEMQSRKEKFNFESLKAAGNYFILIEEFVKQQPVYFDSSKNWWLWNHKEYMWEKVDETDLMNLINESTDSPSTGSRIRGEILEAFRQVGRKNKPKDAEPHWVQFKDKIYDLNEDKVFPATSEYFITNPIKWSLGDSEETPEIDKLFDSWVGEHKQELYEVLAFSLVPQYFIHRIICLNGSGANGKSTYLSVLSNFIGDHNITSTSLSSLCGTMRFETSKLFKKLVCLMGETNFTTIKQTESIKGLSGESMQRGEYKGTNNFDFINYSKLIMATNSLPITMDKTDGFYRRWKIIDFLNRFAKEKDVLKRISDAEYNNLALKCLNIAKRLWAERLFTNDGDFEDRRKAYEEHSNPIMMYINEIYTKDIHGQILYGEFFDELTKYLEDNGHRTMSWKDVSQVLHTHGFITKNKTIKKNGKTTSAKYVFGLHKRGTASSIDSTDSTLLLTRSTTHREKSNSYIIDTIDTIQQPKALTDEDLQIEEVSIFGKKLPKETKNVK